MLLLLRRWFYQFPIAGGDAGAGAAVAPGECRRWFAVLALCCFEFYTCGSHSRPRCSFGMLLFSVCGCYLSQDNRAISFDGMARACAEAMGKDPAGEKEKTGRFWLLISSLKKKNFSGRMNEIQSIVILLFCPPSRQTDQLKRGTKKEKKHHEGSFTQVCKPKSSIPIE